MGKPKGAGQEGVAEFAGRVLAAWRNGAKLGGELDRARSLACHRRRRDTLEMEKMEVLEGAVEALEGGRDQQVHAAVLLLEHLVKAGGVPISR
jgi:hypothetical protein